MYFRGINVQIMRRIIYLSVFSILLLYLLPACSGRDSFLLKGELTDSVSSQEPILVIFDDPEARLDTIFPQKGKFTYKLTPDTLTLLRLINKEGQIIPVFAHKGWEVHLKGTFRKPDLKGDGANLEFQEFLHSTANLQNDEKAVVKEAEKFIRNHPQSVVSAYLLDRYFIQQPHPDVQHIMKLISPLSGNVKDSRILNVTMKSFPAKELSKLTHLNYYACKDRKGKYISWSSNDKYDYTLVNFWASWSASSLTARKELETLIDSLPKNSLKILNISLDFKKEQWLDACKADTTSWIETCDFKGWENQLVKQHNIDRLPASILIDKDRKIIGTDLSREMILQKLKEKEQEKKAEEKEKKKK